MPDGISQLNLMTVATCQVDYAENWQVDYASTWMR